MQVLIVTHHLLRGSMLGHALRRENISSLVFSPNQLKEEGYLSFDALLLVQAGENSLKNLAGFLNGFSVKIPIFLIGTSHYLFKKEDLLLAKRCILVSEEISLEELSSFLRDSIQRKEPTSGKVHCGTLTLDKEKRKLSSEESTVQLTKKEFFLLELFLSNAGQIISRERIVEHVWDKRQFVGSNTIDVYVSRLRKKLKLSRNNPMIRTVPCLGYEFQLHN